MIHKQLYYVQDAKGYVGNSMLWWKKDNCGYVCDIRKAKKFTKAEIDKMDTIQDGTKRAWPVGYIDDRVQFHIDMQDVSHKQAMKAIQTEDQVQCVQKKSDG